MEHDLNAFDVTIVSHQIPNLRVRELLLQSLPQLQELLEIVSPSKITDKLLVHEIVEILIEIGHGLKENGFAFDLVFEQVDWHMIIDFLAGVNHDWGGRKEKTLKEYVHGFLGRQELLAALSTKEQVLRVVEVKICDGLYDEIFDSLCIFLYVNLVVN